MKVKFFGLSETTQEQLESTINAWLGDRSKNFQVKHVLESTVTGSHEEPVLAIFYEE